MRWRWRSRKLERRHLKITAFGLQIFNGKHVNADNTGGINI
jgi:hypothetical protein